VQLTPAQPTLGVSAMQPEPQSFVPVPHPGAPPVPAPPAPPAPPEPPAPPVEGTPPVPPEPELPPFSPASLEPVEPPEPPEAVCPPEEGAPLVAPEPPADVVPPPVVPPLAGADVAPPLLEAALPPLLAVPPTLASGTASSSPICSPFAHAAATRLAKPTASLPHRRAFHDTRRPTFDVGEAAPPLRSLPLSMAQDRTKWPPPQAVPAHCAEGRVSSRGSRRFFRHFATPRRRLAEVTMVWRVASPPLWSGALSDVSLTTDFGHGDFGPGSSAVDSKDAVYSLDASRDRDPSVRARGDSRERPRD
jgi:hypothetical protein